MSAMIGAGDFIPWEGGCALIGRALSITPMHAHYAIQIGVGSEYGIRFRPDEESEWTAYQAAIIASRQPHMMDATGVTYDAVIFVEPETPQGRALVERYLDGGIAPITAESFTAASTALFDTWLAHGNAPPTVTALQRAIDVLTHGARAAVVSDERILRAVAYIKSHLDAPLTLEQVADVACLSPSRFRHLFVEQTGTALRPYLLWRRFLLAWELVMRGESLSTAAHAAGFADAAHLTRTSHRMFGFPPSALQINTPSPGSERF
ncbi:helix-turn-helix domain-containing protein [Gemmatimonas groenlandica]|uniref:Helix-turn-helix transcriptional regulator n=1 Tax=Gemmatimonas groenlandica TaxID=2732249 RepID=A0A6M4IWE3_9BACT|nr:AraC family transcriptional regulator [Gemmatimonas groenlandica]QJR37856.1 helix-turn-helix transcriptional regulator [Gemmatimonas groenlandica]